MNKQAPTQPPRTLLCVTISGTRASTYRFAEPFVCRDNSPVFVRPIDSVLYGTRVSFWTVDTAAGSKNRDSLGDAPHIGKPAQRLLMKSSSEKPLGPFKSSCGGQSQQYKLPSYLPPQSDKQGEKAASQQQDNLCHRIPGVQVTTC